MVSQGNKIQIQMQGETLQCESGLSSFSFPNSPQHSSSLQRHPSLSNSKLESLISLQKAPFLIEQPQLQKVATPETTCEKLQHKILHYNRKEKSLEELSKRFLNLFEGKDKKLIELDKVTQQLKVEKRRIYDIINILESLRVVSKNGKNHYKWKGLTEAIETIHLCERDRDSLKVESIWKEKSLEYLSSSLLKLFLHWKTTLSLQEAAKEIIQDIGDNGLKTKIRRFYDIINVFKSLKLVKKTTLPNKKPGFQWLGTEELKNYITNKGTQEDESSDLMNFKLQEQMSVEKQTKSSFFMEFLQTKLRKSNLKSMPDLMKNQLWLTPSPKSTNKKLQEKNVCSNPHIKQNRIIISPIQNKQLSPLF